ncbi:MAG: PAS domain-containing protein, partial [Polaromonas sp.]
MKLPDMTRPAADAVESRLTYTNGDSRTVFASGVEVPFPEGRLIVSRTDLGGIITHANDAFVELSGWERDDLIGTPHHMLRHPDMHKAAFKGLSDTVAQG